MSGTSVNQNAVHEVIQRGYFYVHAFVHLPQTYPNKLLMLNVIYSFTFYLFLLSVVEQLIECITRNLSYFLKTIFVCQRKAAR